MAEPDMLAVANLLARSSAEDPAQVPAVSMAGFAAQSVGVARMLLDAAAKMSPERYAQTIEALEHGGRTRLVIDSPAAGGVRIRLRVLRSPNDPNADEQGNFWCFAYDVPMSALLASGKPGLAGFFSPDDRRRWLVPEYQDSPD